MSIDTDSNTPVVLCKPFDTAQLAMVKSVLQSEEIDFFVENEQMSAFHANMPGLQAVVVVRSGDWESANEAIENLMGYKR